MSLLGYRKFTVALCCWASSSLLCVSGQIAGDQYVWAIGLVVGTSSAANVAKGTLAAAPDRNTGQLGTRRKAHIK